MKGYKFLVSGEPTMARDTVYSTLVNQGFTLAPINDWAAVAERGSSGASIMLGALAGKKGRHVKLDVACQTVEEGTLITLSQGTSGMSGGLIGMSQANKIYSDIYIIVGAAFRNAGVLVSESNV